MIRQSHTVAFITLMLFCGLAIGDLHAQASGGTVTLGNLVAAMKSVQGCVGVETARTSTGKQVAFAWFVDKHALTRWYSTNLFRGVMKQIFNGEQPADPATLKDGVPILMIASITLADKPDGQSVVVSQMSVELYQPLSGGISVGGRFTPNSIELAGIKVIGGLP